VKVLGISWAGVRTDRFAETRRLFESILGMGVASEATDFVVFRQPSGDTFEIFGPRAQLSEPEQFNRNPIVVGFLVDDIDSARAELAAAGIQLLGDLVRDPGGYAWQHFRGPDGNTWELAFDPDHPSVKAAT
jgi:catechol 2,3-dioxygenase-like lactoylglutathione lyase family enzyme